MVIWAVHLVRRASELHHTIRPPDVMKRKTSVSSGRVVRLHVDDASGPILSGKRWWLLGRVVLGVWKLWAEPHFFLTDHQHTARGEVTFMEMRKTSGSRMEAKPPADGRSVFVTGYNPRQDQRPEQNLFWLHPTDKPSHQNKCLYRCISANHRDAEPLRVFMSKLYVSLGLVLNVTLWERCVCAPVQLRIRTSWSALEIPA